MFSPVTPHFGSFYEFTKPVNEQQARQELGLHGLNNPRRGRAIEAASGENGFVHFIASDTLDSRVESFLRQQHIGFNKTSVLEHLATTPPNQIVKDPQDVYETVKYFNPEWTPQVDDLMICITNALPKTDVGRDKAREILTIFGVEVEAIANALRAWK